MKTSYNLIDKIFNEKLTFRQNIGNCSLSTIKIDLKAVKKVII